MFGGLLTAIGGATPWGALLGGVTGLAKKFIEDRHQAKMAGIAATERVADRAHDLALIDKEIEKTTREADLSLRETEFKTDAEALTATVKSQDAEVSALKDVLKRVTWPWIGNLVALAFAGITIIQKTIRPAITCALFVLTCYLFHKVNKYVGGLETMPRDELMVIFKQIIMSVLGLTEMAIAFWFTSRPKK